MEISDFQLQYDYFNQIDKHIRFNDQLADFYRELYDETADESVGTHARRVELCSKYLDFDYYRLQGVKAFRRINLCHDRFCANCQGLLARKRELKYGPILDDFAKTYSLWHVVFTVPNVSGEELRPQLQLMYKKFGYMMRYLKGDAKISGVNFLQYGFAGAIRSLEITQNFESGTFHPHFHCVFMLRKDLQLEKTQLNSYSFSGSTLRRRFSEFEILLQKVWYLLLNGEEVNAPALDELAQGYSVIADPMEPGNYREIFKYAIKGCFKDDALYDFESFRTLYYALYNRRVLQGYGLLYRLDFEHDAILEDEADEAYDVLIGALGSLEEPVFYAEKLEETLAECRRGNIRYISKGSFRRLFEEESRAENKSRAAPERAQPSESSPAGWHGVPLW